MMEEGEIYLGDSVCASFDGLMIWLRTNDGQNQRIALEFYVFENLVKYGSQIIERLDRAAAASGASDD